MTLTNSLSSFHSTSHQILLRVIRSLVRSVRLSNTLNDKEIYNNNQQKHTQLLALSQDVSAQGSGTPLFKAIPLGERSLMDVVTPHPSSVLVELTIEGHHRQKMTIAKSIGTASKT